MKRIVALFLSFVLILAALCGCNKFKPVRQELSAEELQEIVASDVSSSFFEKGEVVPDSKLNAVMPTIPEDKYEPYLNMQTVPLTATLYKDGQATTIDVRDARLIKLINFFNNSVYYDNYAYSQGLLNLEGIEKVENKDFRLELTYTPSYPKGAAYGSTMRFDTIIVTNEYFTLMAHDLPGYEGEEKDYPFCAMVFEPFGDLASQRDWLDLFEF